MRTVPLFIIAAFALAMPACGGGDDGGGDRTGTLADSPGAKVFADADCGNCHTLSAVGASGTVGPNLDESKPEADKVERQVRNGGAGMPSFEDRLSDEEIRDVAQFVADATRTATGGESVALQFKPDDTELADCEKKPDPKCYQQAFANIAYEQGPKPALERFDREIRQSPFVDQHCHPISHAIGGGALAHFDGDVGEAFVAGSPSCTSGYYHGILERAFLDVAEEDLGPASRRFCAGPEIRKVEFIAYQCVHGLGHGLMIYSGYDLPLSLQICDRLQNRWDQSSCAGGVFMENTLSSYGVRSRWLKSNDLIYPCNEVAERHKHYCYDLLAGRLLRALDFAWAKAASHCRRSDASYVRICFQGLGREASGSTRRNASRILAICRPFGDHAPECLYGAARDVVYTDVHARRAKDLCNNAPPSMRDYCWRGIGSILASLHAENDKRKAACDAVTTKHRRACYGGAAVDS